METPNNFALLYTCHIHQTGSLIYKTPTSRPFFIPLTDEEKNTYPIEREIAIKMPESEYYRFMDNWNNYMTIMRAAMNNPLINEQYRQLLILSNMLA